MADKSPPSAIQRLFAKVLPAKMIEEFEQDTREWRVTCRKCGFERDLWAMGGIRSNARGSKHAFGRCPTCQCLTWFKIHRP